MIRSKAREKAFMFLYQLELQKGDEESQLQVFIREFEVTDAEAGYMLQLVKGVREHLAELDARFSPLLKRWTKDRLPRIDLTILRLATYEMYYQPDIPASVAISEAVLLSKKYSSEESRSYINAVLGNLSRSQEQENNDRSAGSSPLTAGSGTYEKPQKAGKARHAGQSRPDSQAKPEDEADSQGLPEPNEIAQLSGQLLPADQAPERRQARTDDPAH